MQNKIFIAGLTAILYIFHFGSIFLLYRFNRKKTFDELRRFGAEFSFIGVSFFGVSVLDKSSAFRVYLDSIDDVAIASGIIAFAIFILIDAAAIFFYKTHLERIRRFPFQSPWRLWLSHFLGIIALGAGISMV